MKYLNMLAAAVTVALAIGAPAMAQSGTSTGTDNNSGTTSTTGTPHDSGTMGNPNSGTTNSGTSNSGNTSTMGNPNSSNTGAMRQQAKGSPDQNFMIHAAQGGLFEVEMGNVAVRRGGRDSKVFGAQMVKDHGNANKQLMAIAAKLGVTLPKAPAKEQLANIQRLEQLSGAAFDNAYLRMMHDDHAKDLKEFQAEVANGKDPQVKAWAAKVVPVIQGHFAMDSKMMANHRGMSMGGGAGH